jgi:hypothetical protein
LARTAVDEMKHLFVALLNVTVEENILIPLSFNTVIYSNDAVRVLGPIQTRRYLHLILWL